MIKWKQVWYFLETLIDPSNFRKCEKNVNEICFLLVNFVKSYFKSLCVYLLDITHIY